MVCTYNDRVMVSFRGRVECVPPHPSSFECRKALPAEWRGLRDQQLSDASGVDGGVFGEPLHKECDDIFCMMISMYDDICV